MRSIGRRAYLFMALMSVAAMILLLRGAPVSVSGQGGGRPRPMPTPRRTPRPKQPRPTPKPKQTPTPQQTAPQIEMVLIPAGTFMMGSPDSAEYHPDEMPQHQVTVRSFYIGKYEVTQAQWRAVMGTNPSRFKGDNRPVENVTWQDAVEFCRRLSQMTGREYRLPSEAEWEYACRAGTTTPFAFGSSLSSEQANFDGRVPYGGAAQGVYREETTPVGSFSPNAFGLYDMHGNVSEWCQDLYHKNYNGAPVDGSAWESGGESKRVMRSGSWDSVANGCRSAFRSSDFGRRYDTNGFRVVAAALPK